LSNGKVDCEFGAGYASPSGIPTQSKIAHCQAEEMMAFRYDGHYATQVSAP